MHSLLNRCFRPFTAAASLALIASALLVVPAAAAGVSVSTILTAYSRPVLVTAPRGSSRKIFIVEQTGKIKIATYDSDRGWRKIGTFLDIRSKVRTSGGEQGLLGLAFSPDYAENGLFYVNYTRKSDGATVVAESRRLSRDPNRACVSCLRQVIRISQPYNNHNGGMIAFGPDDFLYIGMGDGGSADDPAERAQNLDSLLGKMLRINPRNPAGRATYSVPSSNPFVGKTGRDEIWSRGWRNPWRFSFDRVTGDLWAGDVGQGDWEEVDKSDSNGSGLNAGKGDNYGWDRCEGSHHHEGSGVDCSDYVEPVVEYSHGSGRCSVTGGYVYRGPGDSAWHGYYVYADYCTGQMWVTRNSGAADHSIQTGRNISGFGEDGAGRLFATDLGGRILRVSFSGTP